MFGFGRQGKSQHTPPSADVPPTGNLEPTLQSSSPSQLRKVAERIEQIANSLVCKLAITEHLPILYLGPSPAFHHFCSDLRIDCALKERSINNSIAALAWHKMAEVFSKAGKPEATLNEIDLKSALERSLKSSGIDYKAVLDKLDCKQAESLKHEVGSGSPSQRTKIKSADEIKLDEATTRFKKQYPDEHSMILYRVSLELTDSGYQVKVRSPFTEPESCYFNDPLSLDALSEYLAGIGGEVSKEVMQQHAQLTA